MAESYPEWTGSVAVYLASVLSIVNLSSKLVLSYHSMAESYREWTGIEAIFLLAYVVSMSGVGMSFSW